VEFDPPGGVRQQWKLHTEMNEAAGGLSLRWESGQEASAADNRRGKVESKDGSAATSDSSFRGLDRFL
ncbi:hypothetical protein ILYODFUR_025785, partial [Ilyodon furcidens]